VVSSHSCRSRTRNVWSRLNSTVGFTAVESAQVYSKWSTTDTACRLRCSAGVPQSATDKRHLSVVGFLVGDDCPCRNRAVWSSQEHRSDDSSGFSRLRYVEHALLVYSGTFQRASLQSHRIAVQRALLSALGCVFKYTARLVKEFEERPHRRGIFRWENLM